MSIFKICSLIIFYFISRVALSATCANFSGYQHKEKLCFDKSIKGWISERCATEKSSCEARKFFNSKKQMTRLPSAQDGQNPAALHCHQLKLEVIVLKDSQNNEQSFCAFADKTIVDANAIERHMR